MMLCDALKTLLIKDAINERLAYSLQFSRLRTSKQIEANKQLLSTEVREIKHFIEKYRLNIEESIFNTQEFSIKLIQVPKISNTKSNDLAIEFVNWNSVSDDDKENYEKIIALIKDKVQKTEVINPAKLKPSAVVNAVNLSYHNNFNHYDHKCLLFVFSIKPTKEDGVNMDPFETNTKYCHYDEAHNDYLYKEEWIAFIIGNIISGNISRDIWKTNFVNKKN